MAVVQVQPNTNDNMEVLLPICGVTQDAAYFHVIDVKIIWPLDSDVERTPLHFIITSVTVV